MKRGKGDDKIMEPMFPRLHVNDTEKGGPRAPPRNKMALYEQLSIPSQRFNPNSSSQGSDLERNMFYIPEKIHGRQLGGASINAPTAQPRKVGDEDDLLVPVFVNSDTGQQHNKNICDNEPNRSSSAGVGLSREHMIRTSAHLSTRERIDVCAQEDNVSPDQGCGETDASRLSGSRENDACSLQKLRAGRQQVDNGCTDDATLIIGIGEGTLSWKRSISYSEGNDYVPDETNNDSECHVDKTRGSLHLANGDKSADASETSMVDSVSGLDISPDDVVGIIGQKRFWKARRAIVNQQRVFAVQVFELHRLIKVQKLIAGSPHILLEDTAYLSKPFSKDSPAKKRPPEIVVQSLPHAKRKEDTEKLSHKMECSAESVVGRTSLSSVENGSQPSNYGPFLGNPKPSPVNGNNKMNPWGFNQMLGQQWLVPVMSPSEGLVYKPYPGPGFMGFACGGCGPFGQTPMTGNFMASAYGVPAPPHQGLGVLPRPPLAGHSYFLPYGMPVVNPALSTSGMEQMNQFSGPGSDVQSGQLSGSGANVDMQQQGSCNQPGEKNCVVPPDMKFQTSKDAEQQRCTASSFAERSEKDGPRSTAEGKNGPPLLPPAQSIPEGVSQSHDSDQRTRVIRVVPHNPRSATESATRIFRYLV